MKHMTSDTPVFHPISGSLRTTNIMHVVERFGRNPYRSSWNIPLASQLDELKTHSLPQIARPKETSETEDPPDRHSSQLPNYSSCTPPVLVSSDQ